MPPSKLLKIDLEMHRSRACLHAFKCCVFIVQIKFRGSSRRVSESNVHPERFRPPRANQRPEITGVLSTRRLLDVVFATKMKLDHHAFHMAPSLFLPTSWIHELFPIAPTP